MAETDKQVEVENKGLWPRPYRIESQFDKQLKNKYKTVTKGNGRKAEHTDKQSE